MTKAINLPGVVAPLYVNRKIEQMLRAALGMCVQVCPEYKVKSIGCFNPRYKRSSKGEMSAHSWGVAVDINANENPACIVKTSDDLVKAKRDIPQAFVEAFKSIGWTWGGDFAGPYKDFMHFQFLSGW